MSRSRATSGDRLAPSALSSFASRLGLELPGEQTKRLVAFEELLATRAIALGLIGASDARRIRVRHTFDCLRAALVVEAADRAAYDLGSGAGLPGIVVAVARPALFVTLVEARRRRAAFLEFVAGELGLPNVSVAATRAETLCEPADLCFARALGPIDASWALARPLLRGGARLVYFAGAGSVVPGSLPGARSIDSRGTAVLESAGPLVIIARR